MLGWRCRFFRFIVCLGVHTVQHTALALLEDASTGDIVCYPRAFETQMTPRRLGYDWEMRPEYVVKNLTMGTLSWRGAYIMTLCYK